MKLNITARNMNVSEGIVNRIEKKTASMNRYLLPEAELQVKLKKEKNGLRIVELTVPMGDGAILRSEASAEDNLFLAIDQALTRLERQIHRHRTKLGRRVREDAFVEPPVLLEEPVEEEEPAIIAKRKTFPIRPMAIEDAAVQMDLLGHSFFAFVDAETNATCVLYRRKDGTLGLLEPEA